ATVRDGPGAGDAGLPPASNLFVGLPLKRCACRRIEVGQNRIKSCSCTLAQCFRAIQLLHHQGIASELAGIRQGLAKVEDLLAECGWKMQEDFSFKRERVGLGSALFERGKVIVGMELRDDAIVRAAG